MPDEYALHFECCGNMVPLGMSPDVGDHDQYCLSCDTHNPVTEVRVR